MSLTARPLALVLAALAVVELVHGILAGALLGGAWSLDPSRWWVGSAARGALLSLAFVGVSGLLALIALAAAIGVALEQPWGRWLAIVVAAGTLFTGCLPLGVVLLVVLLQEEHEASPVRGAA